MSYEKFERYVFTVLIFTVLSPLLAFQWLRDRNYYRNKLFKIRVGDRFVINKDTRFLSSNKVYIVKSVDNNIISFVNDKKWWDKVHISDVNKIITK